MFRRVWILPPSINAERGVVVYAYRTHHTHSVSRFFLYKNIDSRRAHHTQRSSSSHAAYRLTEFPDPSFPDAQNASHVKLLVQQFDVFPGRWNCLARAVSLRPAPFTLHLLLRRRASSSRRGCRASRFPKRDTDSRPEFQELGMREHPGVPSRGHPRAIPCPCGVGNSVSLL